MLLGDYLDKSSDEASRLVRMLNPLSPSKQSVSHVIRHFCRSVGAGRSLEAAGANVISPIVCC